MAQCNRQQGGPRRTAIARGRNSSGPVTAGSVRRVAAIIDFRRRSPDFAKARVFRYRASVQDIWLHCVAKAHSICWPNQFRYPYAVPERWASCIRACRGGGYRRICCRSGPSCKFQAIFRTVKLSTWIRRVPTLVTWIRSPASSLRNCGCPRLAVADTLDAALRRVKNRAKQEQELQR